MTRDYVNYTRRRKRQTRRSLVLFIVLVFSALLPGFFVYTHRQDLTVASLKAKTAEKLAAYFPNLHHRSSEALPLKKMPTPESDSPKPIHFNFYDELPMAQLDPQKGDLLEKAALEEETIEKSSPPPRVKKTQLAQVQPLKPEINQQEEAVVQELAKDLSSMKTAETITPSILQVSVFHSLDAAKRYRAALAAAGLKVDLVTLRVGKKVIYRLQQGPYHQQDLLKLAKKRLNERGIACEIRKLPP